jgi:segregation and condensation protein B
MHVDELAKLCKAPVEDVRKALLELRRQYSEKNTSLMMVEEGSMWKLTVREKFIPLVQKIVSETELPRSVIETLAVIAFKHPILQSEVVKIRTNKAYDHLAELEEAGYIVREKHGRTKRIKLAQKFFEYFDLPPEKMREAFVGFEAVEQSIAEKEKEVLVRSDRRKLAGLEVYESQRPDKSQKQAKQQTGPETPVQEEKLGQAAEVSEISEEEEGTDKGEQPYREEEEGKEKKRYPKEGEVEEESSEESKGSTLNEPESEETEEDSEAHESEQAGSDMLDFFKGDDADAGPVRKEYATQDGADTFLDMGRTKAQREKLPEIKQEPKIRAGLFTEEEEEQPKPQEQKFDDPDKMIEHLIEKRAEAIIHPPKEEKQKTEEPKDFLSDVYNEVEEEKKELEKKTR